LDTKDSLVLVYYIDEEPSMFETIDTAELKFPPGLLDKGQRVWQYINIRLHVPLFFMHYQTEYSDGTKLINIMLLAKEEHIVDIQSIDNCKIIETYLVSPSHLNGSDCTKMEKLKEIWTASIKNNTDEMGMIYVLQDNSEYTYSQYTDNNEELIKNKLLIKI